MEPCLIGGESLGEFLRLELTKILAIQPLSFTLGIHSRQCFGKLEGF